jgi:hypothetical protein
VPSGLSDAREAFRDYVVADNGRNLNEAKGIGGDAGLKMLVWNADDYISCLVDLLEGKK